MTKDNNLKIAENPNSSPEELDWIVMDSTIDWASEEGEKLINALASNPNCPQNHLETLYSTVEVEVQSRILKNPNCPEQILDLGFDGDNDTLKKAVLSNPSLVGEWLVNIVKKESIGSEFIVTIGERDDLDSITREIIDLKIKFAELKKENSDKGEYAWLEDSLLSVTDWGKDIFDSLYKDNDQNIRVAIAKNPSVPEYIVSELITDLVSDVKIAALSNPSCNEEMLIKASSDNENYSSSLVRKAVALNIKTPREVIDKLIKDEYRWVRESAASHPSIKSEEIMSLVEAQEEYVEGNLSGDYYLLNGFLNNPNCAETDKNKINEKLKSSGYEQKYDTYTLGFDCPCWPTESVAGDVELDDVVSALTDYEGDWAGYMWDNDWYDFNGYYHAYGMNDTATDIEYPDGTMEPIDIAPNPDDCDYNTPSPEELGEGLPPGSFFATGCSYEKTGDGWNSWMKYIAEIEYELKKDKIVPYYESGNVTSYEHDEMDTFESNEDYSTRGKGSDFCLYMVTKDEGVVELDLAEIFDEIIEAGIDETDEDAVRSFLEQNYSGE